MTFSERSYPVEAEARAEVFMRDTEELGLAEHLGRLGPEAHIIAPAAIVDRVCAARVSGGPSFSTGYDALPPFSQDIYVYDLVPGSPSRMIEAMRPLSMVKVINRDLPPALAAVAYRPRKFLPQRLPQRGKEIRYCILHTPRAGGQVLAHLLTGASLGRPLPHLQKPVGACLRDGFLFDDVMQGLLGTLRNPVFSTVIDAQFFVDFLCGRLCEFVHWARENKVKCLVMRRDATEQAVSQHFASSGGLWETWRPVPENYGVNIVCDQYEMAQRVHAIQKLEALLDYVIGMLPQDQIMIVDYGQLAKPNALARKASAFLGFDRGPSSRQVLDGRLELPVRIGAENPFMQRALAKIHEFQPGL